MVSLTAADFFRRALKISFKKVDKNHSGSIDPDELTAALAHLYFQVSKRAPGISDPPTASDVKANFRQFDRDGTGELTFDEYEKFVKAWVKEKGMNFTGAMITHLLVNFGLIPFLADNMHKELANKSFVRYIPKKAFLVAFALVSKFAFQVFRKVRV
eukprot:Plantae.Rhodophyta-Purpureofilum_apyrenoidigerum.ctg29518.p1 GENE.Plantae.Rhodophyta-Purpureofilum_apyrenoidigerum.ctg29518~~Plantae.Rhodophyta-Purpureofilum_apyrenoidigerum.ctg29518.p1  ORF type:complete len:157 (+),score=29.19 Plantae.Rhodophyta-Purpureofilum_apyrenoidigerum.ctg29518:83-553(+)